MPHMGLAGMISLAYKDGSTFARGKMRHGICINVNVFLNVLKS